MLNWLTSILCLLILGISSLVDHLWDRQREFRGVVSGLVIGKQRVCVCVSKSDSIVISCFLKHKAWESFLISVVFWDHRAQIKFSIRTTCIKQECF